MSEPELARPDAAEADVSGAEKKRQQLKAARELKAEKKRKRESQLDDIEARLASLTSILPKKEKATSVEVSEDEVEEEEKDISEPAPTKKVRITREVPTKEEDEDEQAEGWGPFIFRTALPVLLPAVSYGVQRYVASLSENTSSPVVHMQAQPPTPQPDVPVPARRVQVQKQPRAVPSPPPPQEPKVTPVGGSGFVVN